jgi:hypothetical protein
MAICPSFDAGVGGVSTAYWANRLTPGRLYEISACKMYTVLHINMYTVAAAAAAGFHVGSVGNQPPTVMRLYLNL